MKKIISKIGLKYNGFVKKTKDFWIEFWNSPDSFIVLIFSILAIVVLLSGIIGVWQKILMLK